MDRKAFYDALRRDKRVFGSSLGKNQVKGMEGILNAFVSHGDGRAKTLAYALATAYHETGRKMVPVREGFRESDASARAYVQRHYGHKGKNWYCWPAGPYGHVYYGRGIVQLTWLDNYESSSKDAGVDLVKNPDAALDPVIGARLLIRGLLDGRWNAHGKGIAYYLPDGGQDDLKGARRTVNVTDKWADIARYYEAFLAAIKAADGVPASKPIEKRPQRPAQPDPAHSDGEQAGRPHETAPVKPRGRNVGIAALIALAVGTVIAWLGNLFCSIPFIGGLCG